MRRVALAMLAATGCNWVWDLEETDPKPPDPVLPRVSLQLQLSTTNPANGSASQTLAYAPISPPPPTPTVRVGPLDGALSPVEYETDGTVQVRSELFDAPWRFVYQLAGDVPREVQWQPSIDQPTFIVVPRLGRTERLAAPMGSGFSISTGAVVPHGATDVFTTGAWTKASFSGTRPATLTYELGTKAVALEGELAAPSRAAADHGVLIDYASLNGCRRSVATAAFLVPDLSMSAGAPSAVTPPPPYLTTVAQPVKIDIPLSIFARLRDALMDREGTSDDDLRWEYGYIPSPAAFAFVRPGREGIGELGLPHPHLVPLVRCTSTQSGPVIEAPAHVSSDVMDDRFPLATYVEIADTRTVSGVPLRSGFAALVTSSSEIYAASFNVAAPKLLSLRAGGVEVADLSGQTDDVQIPAGAAPLELQITLESEPGALADVVEVIVHAKPAGTLVRTAVITTTGTTVQIDREYLQRGAEHVLEVRTYRGRPGAQRGDFRVNSLPQYVAVIFSRTFRAPP